MFSSFPSEDVLEDIGEVVLAFPCKKPKGREPVDLFVVADKDALMQVFWYLMM